MDAAFPGSKFILSVRDGADQWYRSLARFSREKARTLIGFQRLMSLKLIHMHGQVIYGMHHGCYLELIENSVWDEKIYKRFNLQHVDTVQNYFEYRRNDLLVVSLSEADAMQRLCEFLEVPILEETMPKLSASG